MKNSKINLLIIFVILISLSINAQEKGDIVILDVPTTTSKVQGLVSGETLKKNAEFLQSGIKYKVVSKLDNVV